MHFGGQNLNPATFKYTWKGDWKPHVVYMRHDVVRHRGRTWYAKNDAGANERYQGYYYEPGKSTFWENHTNGNVNRGGWSPQRTYHKGDLVSYKGDWYVCVTGGRGIHPVYDHGALTNKWTRVTKSPRMSNPGKFVPLVASQSPLGWDRHYGTDAPMQQGMEGCYLVDWDGNPHLFGGKVSTTGGLHYLGTNSATASLFGRRGRTPSMPWTDFLEHDKQPITGQNEIIQIALTGRNAWYLANNGEVFHSGFNGDSQGGTGDHTTRNYGPSTVGKDNSSTGTNWNTAISAGTFRDSFIVKLATCSTGYVANINGNCIALDSDGQVWTWGEHTYGALGYGYPENAPAFGADSGTPFKLDYNIWFGGSPIIDIWTFMGPDTNGRQGVFALDNNGILWAWGENHLSQLGVEFDILRRPMPVFDCGKHGGLKKLTAMHNYYGSTILLMNDGSLHISGSGNADSTGIIFFGGESAPQDANDRRPGFVEVSQMFYNSYRKQYPTIASMADVFQDVQNIWMSEGNNAFNGNVAWQNYDHDIFVIGDALTNYPTSGMFTQNVSYRQNETDRIDDDINSATFPLISDWSSLNGQVEYLQWYGGYDTNTAEIGCTVMSEDGRIKAAGATWTNADNTGMGINQSDTATGGNHQAFQTGAKTLFADEMTPVNDLLNGGPTSQHFGPMSQKATHTGGIAGTTDTSSVVNGAYVTFYEDGTAGFFGKTQLTVAHPIGTRNNFTGSTVTVDGRQTGRIRPF